jgi:hypothetical protein
LLGISPRLQPEWHQSGGRSSNWAQLKAHQKPFGVVKKRLCTLLELQPCATTDGITNLLLMEFGYLSEWKSHLRMHINLDAARAYAKFLIVRKMNEKIAEELIYCEE